MKKKEIWKIVVPAWELWTRASPLCWLGLALVHVAGASQYLRQQVRWIPTSQSRSSCRAGKLE